jgi:hypothetical protein
VKFHSLRRALLAGVFASLAATLLGSCGGGGAAQSAQGGAVVTILPNTGTIYAGVPYSFTITGGRAPYFLGSSEPVLLPVPQQISGNTFTAVAANPGVVDVGLDPNAVPTRSVIITVRDSATVNPITGTYNVAQNFLTGYGVAFAPVACPSGGTGTVPAGCEINVTFNATTHGNLFGDRPFRVEVIRGPVFFVDFATGAAGQSIVVRSDHSGTINALMRTAPGVPTQLAMIRVTDVGTGAYTDTVFTVTGPASPTALTAIPATLTFTGPDTTVCGGGVADVFIFDGTPPYTALTSSPGVTVTPVDPNNQPGVFRIGVVSSTTCLSAVPVVFTDRFGLRTTVTVTTARGTTPPPAPPTPPVTLTPATIALGCAQSGSVSITGGTTPYSASSPTPGIIVTVTGNTLTITRSGVGNTGAATPTTTANVFVTDGATVGTATVTTPTVCP